MPDAELRRQRAAYRRGLLRATAVAAIVIAAIASLTLIAVRQRNLARAEAERADRNLQQANVSAQRAQEALVDAERHRRRAEGQQSEAEQQRQEALDQKAITEEQRNRAEHQERVNRGQLYAAHMNLAMQAYENSDIDRLQELLEAHRPRARA